ncbi:MAG: metalloregulator ArsR/SmtB family transcription factor [Alphaproteobacteria bacterium]|nr:metalloregulator ArsR/SmtB family transcription factor [Alphaproteobacteria bacterium]
MESLQASSAFAALGQATRLDIVGALAAAGAEGLTAGEIAHRLAIPPSTLSFHLRALDQVGLIDVRRQGRSLIHVARAGALRELAAYLTRDVGRGDAQAGADGSRATPFNVLFLCTRNSARSIIAEALLARIGDGRFVAHSAGTEPAPEGPMPEILAQLRALGHDVSRLRSKHWTEFSGPDAPRMDFVVTLCDVVSGQSCPDFAGLRATAAWPLPDPAKFSGSAAERATLLNELHAGLRRRLEIFVSLPLATLDAMSLARRLDELADPHAVARHMEKGR